MIKIAIKTIQLGKVRHTLKGEWDSNVDYEIMDVVYYEGLSYEALIDVPIGTPITNTSYWMKLVDNNVVVVDIISRLTVLEKYDIDTRMKVAEAIINNIGNPEGLAQLGEDGKLLSDQLPLIDKKYIGLENVENVSVNNILAKLP